MPPLFIPPPLASSRILPTLCVDGRGGVSPLDRTISLSRVSQNRECAAFFSPPVCSIYTIGYLASGQNVARNAKARSEDQTGWFSHQGGHLILCPTIFTESLSLASRGGEKVGDHRPCGERKNRTGGLVDADLGGTGGGLDHPRPVDKREVASVCGSNCFLIFYLTPKMEIVDVPTNPSSRRISSRFVR
ncbi:hypothetical protein GS458_3312 [Geobacillus stearothermophilus]|nr:hypothetical protein GS458_3312 [Geobacillus stearothermophilus]